MAPSGWQRGHSDSQIREIGEICVQQKKTYHSRVYLLNTDHLSHETQKAFTIIYGDSWGFMFRQLNSEEVAG